VLVLKLNQHEVLEIAEFLFGNQIVEALSINDRQRMISKKYICYCLFGLLTSTACAQSTLSETRTVVENWVEARQLASQLKADWRGDREVLEQVIAAFENEKISIENRIDNTDASNLQISDEFDQVSQEKHDLITYSNRLKSEATRLESKLNGLSKRLPNALQDRISTLLDRIPEVPSKTKLSVATRMQTILGVVNEIDKFNSSINVVSELRKNPSGAEVQVQVLYVGLAQAFFSDSTGAFAGVGMPAEEGWNWELRSEWAPRIQRAIEMYQGLQPAAFVSLPFQLK